MKTVAVIGAGQMGAGIAQVSAAAGCVVLLSDLSLELAEKGKAGIAARVARMVEKGQLPKDAAEAALAQIKPVAGHDGLDTADLIIEAATEREDIKRKIFDGLKGVLGADAILATNTSSIPITRLAQSVPDPARFVGMHFFNPVPVMGLIELIRGMATSDATMAAAEAFAARLGKKVVHAGDMPGFVVNRMLLPLLNEACFLLGEGTGNIVDIDMGSELGLGHPIGPFKLADFIGLDTCLEICKILHEGTGDQKYRPAPLLAKYVEAGWLGRKTGRGFYDYSGPEPVPTR